MNHATPELHARIIWRFGVDHTEHATTQWMRGNGWTLTTDKQWVMPKHDHYITSDEAECIRFLLDEFGYRSTVEPTEWKHAYAATHGGIAT